jgi:peroxiredoxin Q/BCP
VLTAYGAYGEKSLYGKTVARGDPVDLRLDEGGHGGLGVVRRQAKGHVAKLRRELGVDAD